MCHGDDRWSPLYRRCEFDRRFTWLQRSMRRTSDCRKGDAQRGLPAGRPMRRGHLQPWTMRGPRGGIGSPVRSEPRKRRQIGGLRPLCLLRGTMPFLHGGFGMPDAAALPRRAVRWASLRSDELWRATSGLSSGAGPWARRCRRPKEPPKPKSLHVLPSRRFSRGSLHFLRTYE